ncbi:DNA polymerase epsilon subunit C [Seiridium cupressi]
MATDEGSWAPKSPDLSSFFSSGGPDSNAPNVTASFTSAPHPTSGPGSAAGPGPTSGYSPSTYNSHQPLAAQAALYGQPQPHQPYSSPPTYNNYNPYTAAASSPNSPRTQQQFFPPQPSQDPYGQAPPPGYVISQQPPSHTGPQPYYASFAEAPSNHYPPAQAQPLQPAQQHNHHFQQSYDQQQPHPADLASPMPPRKTAAAQMAQQPEIMASPVRTKFPTARIKRIMQADEEVGKVAQQTPIAVGKALELFMVQIVTKSADVAKDKSSKRITAQMLKQAVEGNQQWDFLQDIVGKVSEKEEKEPKAKTKTTDNTDSDEEFDAEPKKKGRGGRKKKAAS